MQIKKSTRLRRFTAMLTASAMFAVGLAALGDSAAWAAGPAPIEQRSASTVTADPLPTVQIDSGIVWTQVINGTTVYAGGSFSNARPAGAAAGTGLMPRSNILAYDINTGVATSFAPKINGTVKALALSPDGSRLFVGGSFSQVNGATRFNFAAFDTATGALLTTVQPAIGGSYVNAIAATNTTIYLGGLIGAAGGVARKNLAAVSATNGAVLGWAPTADLQVDSMLVAPAGDKIVIAGRFEKVNGVTSRGMGALSLTTGASLPWKVDATIKNGLASGSLAGRAGIWSITKDATGGVYGTAWVYSNKTVGNLEGLFAVNGSDGSIKWIADCHGDHYGIYSDGTNVYSTGHEHDCSTAGGYPQAYPAPGNMRNATAYTAAAKGTLLRSPSVNEIYSDWSGYPAPAPINWYPDWTTGTASGSGQAGWTATGNGTYLLIGGEFPYVNGQRSQGLARFSNHPSTGAKQGPRVTGTNWTPTWTSPSAGTVRVSIQANWDRDDLNMFYELWEQGGAAPVATASGQSTFWKRPTVAMTVQGLAAGSKHTYYVLAKDADGNSGKSASVTATVAGTGTTHANPVASFTSQVSGLSVSFSSSGSSASGGATISSYAWKFGDGGTSTAASPTHQYAAAGTYTVTLTVTDSQGSVSSPATANVTTGSATVIAKDDFERTVASGWGSASVGGAWSTTTGFSVANGVGSISVSAGQTRTNALASVSAQNADIRFLYSTDRVGNGGGTQFNFAGHKSAAGEYRVKLKIASTGVVNVGVAKLVGTTETMLASQNLASYTHTGGGKLQVRFQLVTSGGTTTLRAKAWANGLAEPSAWNVSVSDAQAELQGAGQVGLTAYTSGSTTNGPVIMSIDSLDIR